MTGMSDSIINDMEGKETRAFSSGCHDCGRSASCFGCTRKEPRGKLMATDWLADVPGNDATAPVEVLFKNTRFGFYSNPSAIPLKIGDIVAVEASPGHDIGKVVMTGHLVTLQMKKAGVKSAEDLKKVFRIAKPGDIEKFEEARAKEHSTMIKARGIAEELGLSMKIGDVEYQGDGGKAIFYYIADERVDFRKLIRILADTFKVRIEMKQIGARQEAGRIGGIGPCGRPLCCSSWMNRFVSVGTGSARLQDLSMNPQKLAGQCAKLKCCLNFEVDSYAEAQKQLPSKEVVLETKDGNFYLFKSDILARKVTYSTDKNVPANLVTIDASRAFEIIALNKQGIKVDSLDIPDDLDEEKEYGDIIGQDSLTRFDKNKKKKKKKKKDSEISDSQKSQAKPVLASGKQQNPGQPSGRPQGQNQNPGRQQNPGQPSGRPQGQNQNPGRQQNPGQPSGRPQGQNQTFGRPQGQNQPSGKQQPAQRSPKKKNRPPQGQPKVAPNEGKEKEGGEAK